MGNRNFVPRNLLRVEIAARVSSGVVASHGLEPAVVSQRCLDIAQALLDGEESLEAAEDDAMAAAAAAAGVDQAPAPAPAAVAAAPPKPPGRAKAAAADPAKPPPG